MRTDRTIATEGATKPRDLRLDFFRGMAMFIILLAHTPGNPWTLWIPARFGFSDATEIFVFCSGMASALAFGAVFAGRSWWLGTARIAFRIWQVYWAHIGVVLITAAMMVWLESTGLGTPDKDYTRWFPIGGFFSDTAGRPAETLTGLFSLTYVPGLFDILPMYLVILAMVPLVMAIHRAAGKEAVFVFVLALWGAANLAGLARHAEDPGWLAAFLPMNLPGIPWEPAATWFFNPFGWALVFFTGFSFGMGWLPAPPVRRWLVLLAIGVIVVTLPVAWHKMFQYYTGFLPETWGGRVLWDAREAIEALRWKTWVGAWRFAHFLAVAYLAWAAVGPGGIRLTTGWTAATRAPDRRARIRLAMLPVLLATAPYAYVDEIRYLAPGLDAALARSIAVDARFIGILQLVHLAALLVAVWHSIGDGWRRWLVRDAFLACVPVIRKVGTQSLAVFLMSIVVSRFNGWWMDAMGAGIEAAGWRYLAPRDAWMLLMVNGTGFAILIATAYGVGWIKRQPWRERPRRPAPASPATPRPLPAE